MTDEPTITVPVSEFENLFNLAMMMQGKEQILSTALKRLQDAKPVVEKPKLVKET